MAPIDLDLYSDNIDGPGELWAVVMEEALKMGFFFVRIPCSDVSVNREKFCGPKWVRVSKPYMG